MVGGILTVAALTVVWIALVGQLDAQDLLAGSVVAVGATALGYLLSHQGRALPGLRVGDMRQIAALPKQIAVETGQVFAAAARKAAGGSVKGSWVHEPVDVGGGGWSAARRDSVLTALLSVSPGAIVVDIDADSGVALIHRLGFGRHVVNER